MTTHTHDVQLRIWHLNILEPMLCHFYDNSISVYYAQIPCVFKNKQMRKISHFCGMSQDPNSCKTPLFLMKTYVPNCKPLRFHSSV